MHNRLPPSPAELPAAAGAAVRISKSKQIKTITNLAAKADAEPRHPTGWKSFHRRVKTIKTEHNIHGIYRNTLTPHNVRDHFDFVQFAEFDIVNFIDNRI